MEKYRAVSSVNKHLRGAFHNPITTPVTLLYTGGTINGPLTSCASGCLSIAVQLVSATGEPFSFTLVDGEEFTTFAAQTTVLRPPPGQKFIQVQPSVPIVLKRNDVRRVSFGEAVRSKDQCDATADPHPQKNACAYALAQRERKRLQLHSGYDEASSMDVGRRSCLYHGRWCLGRELGDQPAWQA